MRTQPLTVGMEVVIGTPNSVYRGGVGTVRSLYSTEQGGEQVTVFIDRIGVCLHTSARWVAPLRQDTIHRDSNHVPHLLQKEWERAAYGLGVSDETIAVLFAMIGYPLPGKRRRCEACNAAGCDACEQNGYVPVSK